MTAKQIYRKIGGKLGEIGFNGVLERIRKAHGLKVLASEESADEYGKHSNAMVIFGYDNSETGFEESYRDFEEARMDVLYHLRLFDFGLQFECNGDGDGCILMSYRII